MYTVEEVIKNVDGNSFWVSIAGLTAMLSGYLQCIESLRLGFRDRTHSVPIAVATFWVAHDSFYTISYFSGHGVSNHWFFAGGGWAILPFLLIHLVIAYQIIVYSGREIGLGKTIGQIAFNYLLIQVAMYIFFVFMRSAMNDPLYLTTSGISMWVQTAFMIPMLIQRKSRKGQSVYLAVVLGIIIPLAQLLYFPLLANYYSSPIVVAMWLTHLGVGIAYVIMVLRVPTYRPSTVDNG